HACTLGQSFGLLTIYPVFIRWHRDQIVCLGLQQRVAGVRAIDTQVATYMEAFTHEQVYRQVKDDFVRQVEPLVEAGAEVIIPAGGLPMLLFAREREFTIGNAVVRNGIATIV